MDPASHGSPSPAGCRCYCCRSGIEESHPRRRAPPWLWWNRRRCRGSSCLRRSLNHLFDIMACVACLKIFIVGFIRKEGFHPLYLEIHLDAMGQPLDQIVQAGSRLRIRVHRRADRRKQMRVTRGNDLVRSQIQGADKCRAQLREKMKRTAEKCNIAADRLAACQTADGLVDNRLENGGGQILFCCAFVDDGYPSWRKRRSAPRSDRLPCNFRVLIKTGCVRLSSEAI